MPLAMADEGDEHMNNQSQFSMPEPPLPFKSTADKLLGLAQLAALSVWLPLRKNIGLKILRIPILAGMVFLMLAFSWVGNVHIGLSMFTGIGIQYDDDSSLFYYALLVLGLGIWQHWKRLQERKLGIQPHRYSVGDGWFYGFVPLPRKHIDMFVDPAVAFVVGGLLRYELGFGLLGLWLMWSAVATCGMEVYRHRLERELIDQHDDLEMEARAIAEIKRQRSGKAAVNETGTDDGLQALIDKNKQENPFEN